MEPNEFYVYPGTYYSCGGCGSSLSPYAPNTRPYKPKVCCYNPQCPKYLIIFFIGEEARIPVFETGERAPPDPARLATPGAGGVVGTGLTQTVGGIAAAGAENLAYDPTNRTIITRPGTTGT